MRETSGKLQTWQDRLAEADRNYSGEVNKMDHREAMYRGSNELTAPNDRYEETTTPHVRNIIFENIESEVSSSIPQPKVTPRKQEDEKLAEIIEHMLRNELDRMPFEELNDMAERTVPLQGGVGFLVDWDNTKGTHDTVGELTVNVLHPKQFAPQPGVYSGPEDMDWFIIKVPTTKEAIKRRYNISVEDESEAEPDIRSTGAESQYDDSVTQYIGYEINDKGGINRYSWVNEIELEDLENYQARRQPVCKKCGRTKPLPGQIINANVKPHGNLLPDPERGTAGKLIPDDVMQSLAGRDMASGIADKFMSGEEDENAINGMTIGDGVPKEYNGGACPWCGCEEWTSKEQAYEEVMLPIMTKGGVNIPGATPGVDENGMPVMQPTMVPFYQPDIYPIVLQKSVSVYGQLLGNSDADAIEYQQNTVNLLEKKLIDRMMKAGTRITLPDRADIRIDPKESEIIYVGSNADMQMIRNIDFTGNLQWEMSYLSGVYEEARQILGITDSFQGRADPTATSGKAREFAAAQSAGRMESKRVMKNAAYAKIFELMFKFKLAYADEPISVSYKDTQGKTQFEEFNRYDFLKQGPDGEYYWEDQFLFSCDASAPLANNREAMWKENRENLQTGAFGDPAALETLILFWTKMEELHYPGAGSTKSYLEERLQEQQMQQQQMMAMQQQMQQAAAQQAAAPDAQQQGAQQEMPVAPQMQ